ncbi:MAG: cold-shock protein, partial [Bdellovibrionales bacterium]|nr:cold-shock protein [Bdellovibrionales bacterium]
MSDSDTLRGTVKWFNDAKGFGFIEHNTGRDVFVHYSVIEASGFKTLKDGEEVTYEIKEGPKGLHAVKVQRADQDDDELALASDDSDSDDSDD